MQKKLLVIGAEHQDARADLAVSELLEGQTRSGVQKLMLAGAVLCGGRPLSKNDRVAEGQMIEVLLPDPAPMEQAEPENIPLDIVYEDDDLLVVNKPKGMVVHPAPGNRDKTLVNALLYHCGDSLSGINGVIRPGIVHRIDKDTSGLLIVAKNDFAHQSLAAQIKEHSFTREYEAVVYGHLREQSGTVDAPIGRHPTDRKKMTVTQKNSRRAVTHYQVLEELPGFSYVRLRLETGRTHQIRVHMAYLGHPVAGDPVYGPKKVIPSLNGQCLHARVIGFRHPRDGRYIELTSPLPPYFTDFLARLRSQSY
ncbi:RluA family pseudouridine synthase [Faecalispora jeddahensis]|uniref:RluA family pseudouridine synthase n=1 Tax=Faecalispora jeddahensis TaxID=1414721 RepID=UPI001899DE45|nr:RluA family pseudouridine synthase [Faecalispora jeddahensis]